MIVDAGASAVQAHRVAVDAEHNLLHALPRLAAALVHADPQGRRAMIIMRFWLPISEKAQCGWPRVVLCEVAVASARSVIGRQVLRSDGGRAGR